jgi:hypothetical protein
LGQLIFKPPFSRTLTDETRVLYTKTPQAAQDASKAVAGLK